MCGCLNSHSVVLNSCFLSSRRYCLFSKLDLMCHNINQAYISLSRNVRNSFACLLWSNSNLIVRAHYDFISDLVRTAVAEIALRCTIEVINIERATVSHLDVGGPVTAV